MSVMTATGRIDNEEEQAAAAPFFIVGCVRSGTTLLRNMLCLHDRLECPQETHLFRWAEPFGTPEYDKNYKKVELFKRHRQEDGIANFDFHYSLRYQSTRAGLMNWYGKTFLEQRGNPDGRWFEKTPQHVYNLLLLSAAYPDAKFVHLVRNPLSVVVSIMKGEVMPALQLHGAINYWLEAAMILSQYRALAPHRLLEIRYEDLLEDPDTQIATVLDFIGESAEQFPFRKISGVGSAKTAVRKRKLKDNYAKYLAPEQIEQVIATTEPYFSAYGYRH
jgi:hypothetical protein